MKRILAVCIVLVLVVSLGISGCGKQSAENPAGTSGVPSTAETTTQATQTKTELSGEVKFMSWGSNEEKGLYDQVLANFVKENPKVKTNYIYVSSSDEYYTKLTTMIAGNTAPDVFWILQDRVVEFAKAGGLEELDPYIEKMPELTADIPADLLKYGQYEGKTYSIPKDWAPISMYLNEDLFTAANIPLPKSGWTMDEYLELAKKLTVEKDGKIEQYGAEADNYWAYWMVFGGSYGGKWFKDGKSNFSDPDVIKGLNVIRELSVGKNAPSPAALTGMGTGSDQLFFSGKIAMYHSGRWFVPECKNNVKFKWSVIEMPKGTTNTNPVISATLAVGKSASNKDAAVALIRYCLSRDGQKTALSQGLSMPVIQKFMDDPEIVGSEPDPAPFKAAAAYIDGNTQYGACATGLWAKYKAIITAEFDKAFNGETTMEEAAAVVDKKANGELFK